MFESQIESYSVSIPSEIGMQEVISVLVLVLAFLWAVCVCTHMHLCVLSADRIT